MKRVKGACILQTLIFAQKPEMGYAKDRALRSTKKNLSITKRISNVQRRNIKSLIPLSKRTALL